MPAPWDDLENEMPINQPKVNVVSEKPTSGRPIGNLNPDDANPEKIFEYQDRINAIDAELSEIENAMFMIIDAYSKCKSKVRLELAENFIKAQDGTKKTAGIEILELYAISNKEDLRKDYENYIYFETKKDMLSKIMESKKTRMSGIQSNMKYDNWLKG